MSSANDQSAVALAREAEERDLTPEQVEELRPFARLIHYLRGIAVVDEEAAFEIAAKVIDEIALADSIEAVFAANEKGPSGAEEYMEQPIGVFGAKFWRSAEKFRKGTLGYYVAMDIVDAAGNVGMITVGASNVVASVGRFMQLGAITGEQEGALWMRIHGRDTPSGTLYTVMGAEPPPF
jgi:hypothetical protein